MVTIVSRYSEGFSGKRKKITGGPLYSSDILSALESSRMVIGTRRCLKDLQNLSKDASDLKEIISRVVTDGKFHQSEWCELSNSDTWAACDSYTWTERSWVESARKEMDCHFYVKFCIGKTGNVVITVSYHIS